MMFRVHFADGSTLDVDAATPNEARDAAAKRTGLFITKVKMVKSNG